MTHLAQKIIYEQQLEAKRKLLQELLTPFNAPALTVYPSPIEHFRMRAEFKIWHQDGQCHYTMFEKGQKNKPIFLTQLNTANQQINNLMLQLKDVWQRYPELTAKLFQVEFLTTLNNDSLITLCYHKPLDDNWLPLAKIIAELLDTQIIGRSRGQKLVTDKDYVIEKLTILGKTYFYQQPENSFTQPNAAVNQNMITWACEQLKTRSDDLLELYCGNGNFTLPFCHQVSKVLATEISKTSIRALQNNIRLNHINNLQWARLSAAELTQALTKIRPFRRLSHLDLNEYQFGTVFVDPPRAGVDNETCEFISRFDRILYISCNPFTLIDNLKQLHHTHKITNCALFDQFPYTEHIESGILLER